MEEKIKRISYSKYPIISFVVASLIMYLYLSVSGVLSTGKYSILQGDLIEIYIPAIRSFISSIFNIETPLYSWSNSLGMNTSAYNAAYATGSIFNIFFLLFYNLDPIIPTAIVLITKAGVIAASFTYSYQKLIHTKSFIPVLFSLYYSMCAFQLSVNTVNIIWCDALYFLPFLILFIVQFIKENKWKRLVLLYFYLFIYQFYFAYVLGIISFGFFIVYLFFVYKENIVALLIRYAGVVLLSFGLASILILPTAYFIFTHTASDSTELAWYGVNIIDVYNQLFIGEISGTLGCYPYIYCGIPVLIFVPLYFCNKNINIREKILSGVSLLILVLVCVIPTLYLVMHAFDAPDGWGYRFSFVISYILCFLSCRYFDKRNDIKVFHIIIIVLTNALVYIIAMLMQKISVLSNYSSNDYVFFAINVSVLAFWGGIIFLYQKWGNKEKNIVTFVLLLIMLVAAETIYSGYLSYYRKIDTYPETPEEIYYAWEHNAKQNINSINDDDFYRINTIYDYCYNTDTFFGYNGISDFTTTENVNVRAFLRNIGLFTSPRISLGYGITEPAKSLLAVKYDMELLNPFNITEKSVEPSVSKNEYFLPLGFIVNNEFDNFTFTSSDPFTNINAIYSSMTGEELEIYTKADGLSVSGDGILLREGIEKQMVLEREDDGIGYIDYMIPMDERPAYSAFDCGESRFIDNMPVFYGGYENAINAGGVFNVTYIKEMLKEENYYYTRIVTYPDTIRAVFYYDALFYYYNEAEFKKAFDVLSSNVMSVEECKNGYILGKIRTEENKKLLYTSIPYDNGWSIYIDGVKKEIIPLADEAFIGVLLEDVGEHSIEFAYKVPFFNIGFIVTLFSIIIFIFTIILENKRNNKHE